MPTPVQIGQAAALPSAGAPPWRDWLAGFAAALALYVASCAPGVLWQDSGLAQLRVLDRDLRGQHGLALSHPLYYVVAIAAQALPLGDSAYKTNLVSALCAAITVANVVLLLRGWTGARLPAFVGGAALALSHTFWQHAALAEVYSLTTAILTAELLALQRFARAQRPGWLLLLFGLNGLGVSNHLFALLAAPVYLVVAVVAVWRGRVPMMWAVPCFLAWCAGAGLYLWLIAAEVAAGAAPGAAIRSALFGTQYAGAVLNAWPTPALLGRSVLYLLLNFPTPLLLLALWAGPVRPPALLWRVWLALLVIYTLWAVRYNVPDQYTFFIPAYTLLAIGIGLGAARLGSRHGQRSGGASLSYPGWALLLCSLLPVAVYAALPALAARARPSFFAAQDIPQRDEFAYFLHPWKFGERGPQAFAAQVNDRVPDGAVIIADGTTIRPLLYRQRIGTWRGRAEILLAGAAEPTRERVAAAGAAGRLFVVRLRPGYCPAWLLAEREWPVRPLAGE